GGNGIAEGLGSPGDGILIYVRFDGVDCRPLQEIRRRKIGVTLREVDRVVLDRQPGHLPDDALIESRGAAAAKRRPSFSERRWLGNSSFADRSHVNRIPG